MNTQIESATPAVFGRPSVATRLTLALVAVISSTTVLGGVLGLFGTHPAGVAMARAKPAEVRAVVAGSPVCGNVAERS